MWGRGGGASGVQGRSPTVEPEGRARAEHTSNMDRMSVTLEVSQLDMSVLNWVKPEKSPLMFETAETPQLEIGPYIAVAEPASAR